MVKMDFFTHVLGQGAQQKLSRLDERLLSEGELRRDPFTQASSSCAL